MTKASALSKQNITNPEADKIIAEGGSKFTAKVFLYMFIALAITTVVTFLSGELIRSLFQDASDDAINAFFYIFIGSLIAYIPVMIVTQVSILRGGKGLAPVFVIYAILMGIIMSPFILIISLIDAQILAISFGLTCGAFGIMALIAWTSKKNLSNLSVVGLGFLIGAIFISLFAGILSLSGVESGIVLLDTLVSAGIFIFVILVTIVDLYNIRRIAARGLGSNNLAMVCAFSLYVDFIYVFFKVLKFVLRVALFIAAAKK